MKYRFLYLVWVLPIYLGFILSQQLMVYYGTENTYQNGVSIAADVTEFDIKQIAAQSNGYVVIEFIDGSGAHHERKLSLSIQMAQRIIDTQVIPIRYQPGAFQEIVMIPTYELQKETSLFNAFIAGIGFIVLTFVSIKATRFANKRLRDGEEEIIIERVDQ